MLNTAIIKSSIIVIIAACIFSLNACGFASDQLKDKAEEDRLLKPGALDSPISEVYNRYTYEFLDRYKITHDFIRVSGCEYRGKPRVGITLGTNFELREVYDIFEQDNHTYQRAYQTKDVNHLNPANFDRYTRAEFTTEPSQSGKVYTYKGFMPVCLQSWGATSHVLTVKLYKKDLSTWKSDLARVNPKGSFSEEIINGNKWLVQTNNIEAASINGDTGGAYLHYSTAIGGTGYTLTMQLGANQSSLKYPQTHAQMQAIFKHLIESVKIEPTDTHTK